MEIEQLNTVSVGRIFGAYDCVCCGKHVQPARVSVGAGAVDKLAEIMADKAPSGASVTIAYDYNAQDAFVVARRACVRAGLKCAECKLDADATVYEAEKLTLEEQTRAVIAVGGGTVVDLVKYAAQFRRLPVYVVYTGCDPSPLAPSSLLSCKGAPTRYAVDIPCGLVCDPALVPDDGNRTAATFGSILSSLTAVVDRMIAGAVYGESYCPSLAEQAYAAVAETVERLETVYRPAHAEGTLVNTCVRLSQLMAMKGDSWLSAGSETDAFEALRLIYKREGLKMRSRGETTLLLSRILLRLYQAVLLELPIQGFYPPPDNNARSELLERILGFSPVDAAKRVRPLDMDLKRTMYKLNAVRDEALSLVKRLTALQERGYAVFRRLFPDYGYALIDYIEPADAGLAIALAPDMGGKTTFLTVLKSMGLLEGYLTPEI